MTVEKPCRCGRRDHRQCLWWGHLGDFNQELEDRIARYFHLRIEVSPWSGTYAIASLCV